MQRTLANSKVRQIELTSLTSGSNPMTAYGFVLPGFNCRITCSAVTIGLLLGTGLALAGGDGSKHVEVVRVLVQKQVGESMPKTSITLIVKQPDKRIVSIGFARTKITTFRDDKNTDPKRLQRNRDLFMNSATLFKDGRISLDVKSNILPATGATKLFVKGAVALEVASDEKVLEEKNFKLQAGVTARLGPIQVESKGFQNGQTQVDVYFTTNILKSVQFLDKNEKVLPMKRVGFGGFGVQFHENFALTGKIEAVTVRVTYFSKTQTVIVPLDLSVGLGL